MLWADLSLSIPVEGTLIGPYRTVKLVGIVDRTQFNSSRLSICLDLGSEIGLSAQRGGMPPDLGR